MSGLGPDALRLSFGDTPAGTLEVSFEAIAKVATTLALTVDGVADPSARSGMRRITAATDAPVSVTVSRADDTLRITLGVAARWGMSLGDLAGRLRVAVADGLNASLGTSLGPDAIRVRFDALRFAHPTDEALK